MQDYQSLSHTTWDCKYHMMFIPKKRKKAIFGAIRKHLGEVLHELVGQKDCRILEGSLDEGPHKHVHEHTAEIFGGARIGLHQEEECNLNNTSVQWAKQELRG